MLTFRSKITSKRRAERIIVSRRWRWSLFFLGGALLQSASGLPLGCASAPVSGQRPKPTLSSNSLAQVRFKELSDKWHAATPERRQKLEEPLRQYLIDYPYDDSRRLAWIYLAWILVQKGELLEARELIDKTRSGPVGATNDLAIVTEAALLLQLNQYQEALRLLRPVRGKLIDPLERFLLTEQLVSAALGAELYGEALLYMVDWGAQAPVTQKSAVRDAIVSRLHHTPRRYLEQALVELEPATAEQAQDPARREQREWFQHAIARRLTALAIAERDAELAKFVLDQSAGLSGDRQSAEDLIELAARDDDQAEIRGRTIGLVLATGSSEQRLRSSQVVSAVSFALGLPKSDPEPGAVRLVIAEDAGGPAGAANAFAMLGSRGAALAIAGLDEQSAEHHARAAEQDGMPALLLHPHSLDAPKYSHTLGVSLEQQRHLLEGELRSRGILTSQLIAPDHDACSLSPERSVREWFNEWRKQNVGSLLLLGPPRCAERFLPLIKDEPQGPWLALGLNAATAVGKTASPQILVLGAGRFPFANDDPALEGWYRRQRRVPAWHEALGRDAALMASHALLQLPEVTVATKQAVTDYRNQLPRALRRLQMNELWTSSSSRFDAELSLMRSFRLSDDPGGSD